MATSPIDYFSLLPDEVLVTILSLLPTRAAARTSTLCRRFRHLWETSPSVKLFSNDLPEPHFENFVAMVDRALFRRDPSHPLLSLRLQLSIEIESEKIDSYLYSLFVKLRSLGVRHLVIDDRTYRLLDPLVPVIFSISSLESLSIFSSIPLPEEPILTCLKSLTFSLKVDDPPKINRFLSKLSSLEDLKLLLLNIEAFRISSGTIKKLSLCVFSFRLAIERLSIPSLEFLHLDVFGRLKSIGRKSHEEIPFLRKAIITLHTISDEDAGVVANLLNCVSHAEELSLHIGESSVQKYPMPILLEPGKEMPTFPNLKHLDVYICFHKHNFKAIVAMLRNSPALESVKLVHKTPHSSAFEGNKRKREDWASKLPRNAEGNDQCAYFMNLHLRENYEEYVEWLNEKTTHIPLKLLKKNRIDLAI